MYGLINKAIEVFTLETYGTAEWRAVTSRADLGFSTVEAMLPYDADVTDQLMVAMADQLGRRREDLLEDLGTFLVTGPSLPAIRRLLRFGGVTYEEFLHSLEELSDRVRLSVQDLRLPELILTEDGDGRFRLQCQPGLPGFAYVLLGVLRAMADDYGALAVLDLTDQGQGGALITVSVVEHTFAEGRRFELGGTAQ